MPVTYDEKISVIVPVYNVEKYLNKCIDSILSQTYNNIEVVLIDDESPDNCGVLCDDYAKQDPRIVVIHQKNAGVSAARNTGLKASTGAYIFFVDSDDYLPFDSIEKLYNSIIEYEADISIGIEEYFCYKDNIESHWNRPFINPKNSFCMDEETALKELLRQVYFANSAWGKLYKKTVFEGVFFPEGCSHEPKATIYKTILNSNRIAFCNELVYYYLIRNDGFTRGEKGIKKCEDLVWAIEKQCSDILSVFPYLEQEADNRRLAAYFSAFINANSEEYEQYRKKYWRQIKMLRMGTIKSTSARKKEKVAALLSLLGPRAFLLLSKVRTQ